jgi:biotin operon repressor
MMRGAYALPVETVDLADPHLKEPRELTAEDAQRCGELVVGIQICRMLVGHWRSLYEIGRELDLGHRSVRRYIYALQLAGFDILERQPRGSRQSTMLYRLDVRSWHGMVYLPKD